MTKFVTSVFALISIMIIDCVYLCIIIIGTRKEHKTVMRGSLTIDCFSLFPLAVDVQNDDVTITQDTVTYPWFGRRRRQWQ